MNDRRARWTTPLWGGVILIVLGASLVAPIVVRGIDILWGVITAEEHVVPGTFTQDLDEGTFVVYGRTGSSTSVGPVSTNRWWPSHVAAVEVQDPSGRPVLVSPRGNETITIGNRQYTGIVEFDSEGGRYTFDVDASRPTTVVVNSSILATLSDSLLLIVIAPIGGFCVIGGAVLVIVALVRRSKARREAAPGPPWPGRPPTGWPPAPPVGPSYPAPPPP